MKLIEPQAIRLLSSTVPENDAPAWDEGTAYEIGDSVIHEHRVYKAVTASMGKQPDQHSEGTDAFWRLMGPTNRYAMLDQYVSTQTVAAEDVMTFAVTFNRCTAFALLNFKATSIQAVVKDGDGLVMYDRTVNTLKDVDGYRNAHDTDSSRYCDYPSNNFAFFDMNASLHDYSVFSRSVTEIEFSVMEWRIITLDSHMKC